ncbi:MAG: type II secretion system F family protein [Lachnospiraceae bacterium]|nr:type II secretion system F family protein [Lachnospiraceae bacterium]
MAKKEMLNADEIAFFCTQVSIILNSGVSLHDGMDVLSDDTDNPKAKALVSRIAKVLNDEKPFYQALEEVEVFPSYVINMVRIGELTGRLEEVFKGLADYYENESALSKAVKNAIFQPLVLLLMMFAVMAVLVIKVIPVFSKIFKRFDVQIGQEVNNTIKFATTTGMVALIILIAIIAVVLALILTTSTPKGKKALTNFFANFALTRSIFEKFSLAKFCRAMTLMVKSGVDTTQSIEYAQMLITNKLLLKKIKNCHTRLVENEGFVESISEEKIFPGMFNQILKVSYRSGAYESAWEKISSTYDEEVNETLYRFVVLIEPVMVAIITVIIGIILVSVLLPLMGIMSSVG